MLIQFVYTWYNSVTSDKQKPDTINITVDIKKIHKWYKKISNTYHEQWVINSVSTNLLATCCCMPRSATFAERCISVGNKQDKKCWYKWCILDTADTTVLVFVLITFIAANTSIDNCWKKLYNTNTKKNWDFCNVHTEICVLIHCLYTKRKKTLLIYQWHQQYGVDTIFTWKT